MAETLRFRTVSRTAIQAGTETFENFSLDALDHAMAGGRLGAAYFYSHTIDPVCLQQSLQRVLQEFPILCGQLCSEPVGSLSIGCPYPGVLFKVRECNLPISRVKCGLHGACTDKEFVETINPLLLKRKNSALAKITLTQMDGGGSILGISCAHTVADAYGLYYFIKRWSQVHEGLSGTAPSYDRNVLKTGTADHVTSDSLSRSCKGFRLLTFLQLLKLSCSFLMQKNSIVCRVLRFTRPQLLGIKSAAQKLGTISCNDALSAHLWQFFTKLQNASGYSASRKLLLSADMRPKINYPLSEHYFGNVLSNIVVECSVGALMDGDITSIASKCRQGVIALDRAYFREQLLWLEQQQKKKHMFKVFADVNPYAGDCMISSVFRLPFYDACFDGQTPYWVDVPVVPIPWVLAFMPTPGHSGGIDVHIHLPRSAADKLNHAEWQAELYKYGEAGDDLVRGESGD